MPETIYTKDEIDTTLLEYAKTDTLPDYSQFVTDAQLEDRIQEIPAGSPGPKGDKGDIGDPSTVPGPKGDKGDKGDPGDSSGNGSVTNITFQAGASTNVLVDSLGTTDDARITKLNSLHGQRLVFEFANRTYNHSVQLEQWAGLKLVGTAGLPAREFSTGTVLNYTGTAGSHFKFVTNTGYGYPGDGSSRDVSLSGIQFTGPSTASGFPKSDMVYGNSSGKQYWYYNFHNVGVMGMTSFLTGYVTGVSLSGTFHAQAMSDTTLNIAGSECVIFDGAQSFLDNSTPVWANSGKPFIRIATEKSYIGHAIISARGNSYQILVDGGRNVFIDGVQFDGPGGAFTTNPALKITSATESVTVMNCSFKGINTQNGLITTAAQQANISNNSFTTNGGAPGGDTPLVVATAGTVKFGLNLFPGFNGKLKKSGSAVIYNIDPMASVTT